MSMTGFETPLWADGIARTETGIETGADLRGRESCDLLIIGAGFLGLNAARIAARRGLSVRVIDARRLGEGASGLNGGQVIPGLKYDPEKILAHFGQEQGTRLNAFAESTADVLFRTIADERLDVPHQRSGWIQACHTVTAMEAAAERHRQWQARGANVEMLDSVAIGKAIGTSNYLGGFHDKRAGVVQPYAFVMELARVAQEAGAQISQNVRCVKLLKSDGRWRTTTDTGSEIDAAQVILATNAYTDGLVPGLARTIVPLHSFQIATEVLSPDMQAHILPGGQAVSDSRRIIIYYRKSPDGRLVFGGRGRMGPPRTADDWSHLQHGLTRIFPALAGVAIEKRWFGRVAVTPEGLPHIHVPEKGLVTVVGCQGRGVAMMTAIAEPVVDFLASGDARRLPFPVTAINPIPFHAFRQVGVAATIAWYRMLDAAER
jgi:glycine/D-amino acid oxidase-like deaminating enzyme